MRLPSYWLWSRMMHMCVICMQLVKTLMKIQGYLGFLKIKELENGYCLKLEEASYRSDKVNL